MVFAGLHHLPHLREVLENSYSHLRKGGVFICFEPNRDCWYRTFMLPFRRILKIYTEDEIFLKPKDVKVVLYKLRFNLVKEVYLTPLYNEKRLSCLNKILGSFMRFASFLSASFRWQSFFLLVARK